MQIDTPTYREWTDGTKIWTLNGIVHRQDGPAVEYISGSISWWLHGGFYLLDEFLELTPISPEDKCMLKLRYG